MINPEIFITLHGVKILFMIAMVAGACIACTKKNVADTIKPILSAVVLLFISAIFVGWGFAELARKEYFLFGLYIGGSLFTVIVIARSVS